MANVIGIHGHNDSSGNNVLLAAYTNDIVNVDTGAGYGINLTSSNDVNFATILDHTIFQNYADTPRAFNGSAWVNTNVKKMPLAKAIKEFGTRIYLFNVKIPDINETFESRVFYSDLPKNNEIFMGLDWGTNGATTANSTRFRSANAGFKTYGIKVGDPLFITSGNQIGQYTVARVSDDQMLETVETFSQTETSINYWVGGNWFDVRTNNNDVGVWIGENNDRALYFKKDTLHRRGQPGTPLQTVKGAPGTTSGRSVQNVGDSLTVYFHGSTEDRTGFYVYSGSESILASRPIQPFVDGINSSNYTSVVAWTEGNTYRAYCGNITNQNSANDAYNISLNNVVFSLDTTSLAWSIDPISDVVKSSGTFRESNKIKVFIGNDAGEIMETPSGYSFDTDPIPWAVETRVIYPRGPEVLNDFTRVQVTSRDALGVSVSYKYWGDPFSVDSSWNALGDIENDTTEFQFNTRDSMARGIQFRFEEYTATENTPVIEKISVFSVRNSSEVAEIRRQQ